MQNHYNQLHKEMLKMKKLIAVALSVMFMFPTINALPGNIVDSNPNFSYKIVGNKDAILTEIKPTKLKKLSDPIEGRYNIVEVANDASKAEVVPKYCNRFDVVTFWMLVAGLMVSPLFMFSGFLFDNPNNVPKVGKFKGNKYIYSGITSVDLPHCKKVGKKAFLGCQNLKTVNLPKCTVLEKGSLTCCNNVTKLNVPECLVLDNPFGIDTGYYTYYDAWKSLKELNAEKCTKIEDWCFRGFKNLKKVNLPSLISLGCESFALCRSLNNVSLDSCITIKELAFRGCISLKNVNLPNCEKIGEGAFDGCYNIKKFSAPKVKEVNQDAFVTPKNRDGKTSFLCSSKLEEVYIPNCTYIGENAFGDCKKLKKITISCNCKLSKNSLPFERVSNNELEIVRV